MNGVFYTPFFVGAVCSGCKLNHESLNFPTEMGVYVFRRTPHTAILISARERHMPPSSAASTQRILDVLQLCLNLNEA